MHKASTTDLSSTSNLAQVGKDIKLLVLDIDGTIAGHDNQVSETVKDAIAKVQAKGIHVAIATGRMYCSALRFHQDIKSTLPLVAYQGAWIQDPKNKKIHRHLAVPREITQQLLDYFEQPQLRSLLSVHFYINDQLYVREMTTETELYAERCGVNPIPVGDLRQVLSDEPTKVLALCDDENLIQELLGNLRLQYTPAELYMTTSVATFLEAANPFVNKGTAVRYLAEELLGLERDNVMTIGDNFNDVEMLEYAGIGVAMGSAPDPVQAIANWVAPSVENHGSAIAIEKFLLS
ncbi:Cof-type HAD-IIB family hydrolase [Anabaena cylindrica FACHB-243]|uniref:Cof-like hydrolase n=1 Tax=Anabaena cylindrica (strain ATCC 27899 / PCC 7122) TaxID=272123 RepID=K9ZG87_ANACC|nr:MULTISPECIES: Cof-type HAD-IIB family hydrolase [Anabaena]AFZ58223.1 Cof-like hydrolase [Anabaena cylindrica PCC 7122]MBD2419871.1 Cof-type HAD-IIB family hydrolase [Anabaena cylindrica FACHB-243]MBY5280997.1 Cof-type HAD-IIB family hydrolase [Anabaena sp. CCAP 1446/1C]MBY5307352.1 Cof-type HAD-IIB family hydrolase [Anabaena sp. CCAP 1446/1C]MCM2407930.1 Cof-type HAD-IIB family hydrolase [Anabaena sp. CCAP 1446/1C]